jgi:hypothetical protein
MCPESPPDIFIPGGFYKTGSGLAVKKILKQGEKQ